MIFFALLTSTAPAMAETGYHCRFDVACRAGGCVPDAVEIEIGQAEASAPWIFLSADADGIEGMDLSDRSEPVQVFVLHEPASETTLFTLYPNGRAIFSRHATDPASGATTGFGTCEATS